LAFSIVQAPLRVRAGAPTHASKFVGFQNVIWRLNPLLFCPVVSHLSTILTSSLKRVPRGPRRRNGSFLPPPLAVNPVQAVPYFHDFLPVHGF